MPQAVALAEVPSELEGHAIDELMRTYEDRVKEIRGGKPYYIFNRRVPLTKRKHYTVFKRLFDWCRLTGIRCKDYVRTLVPEKSPRLGPNWLLSVAAMEKYLEIRGEKPAETTIHTNQTCADVLRTKMAASIDAFRQHLRIFKDYDQALLMSGPSLSPEFLATDTHFLKLLISRKVHGAYCGPVADVLNEMARNLEYREMVRKIRDAELSRA